MDDTLGLSRPPKMDDTLLPRAYFTHPEMMIYEDRLQSFEHWSKQISPDKFTLASAGFIYTGEGDVVRCFGCNIRVSQWEKTDNPWTEHLKWSPDCVFLKMIGCGASSQNVATASVAYEKPRHDSNDATPRTGFAGFHTRPNNAAVQQSDHQPGAQLFGRPQRPGFQSGAAFDSRGFTLGGGGHFLPATPNRSNLF
jgi:hypothetical protein